MGPRRTCHEMCSMGHPGRGTASVRVYLRVLSVVPTPVDVVRLLARPREPSGRAALWWGSVLPAGHGIAANPRRDRAHPVLVSLLPTLLAIQHFEKQSCGEVAE